MLRVRGIILLSVSFLFLYISTKGAVGHSASDPCSAAEPLRRTNPSTLLRTNWLVSPELLEHARLKILWQSELPIRKDESLERLILIGNRIYAFSDRNFLVSLDREKGNVIFSRSAAPAGIPVVGLELYRDKLISVIGNKLVEIDPQTGVDGKAKVLDFSIVCPAVRNNTYFYISGPDRRLHILQVDNKLQVFEVSADNDSTITSVIAGERFVIFGTDGGNVISITPDKPKRLWQFDAGGAIAGPIVWDRMSLFFAAKDTGVYRLDIDDPMTVELVWKFQIPSIPTTAPRVTREVVYQYAPAKGMVAIDRQKGKQIWLLEQGVDLLAEAKRKAFVFTKAGTLAVMDNAGAKLLYTVNFARVSRYAANTMDSKIYIADERGRIACLEPIQ